MSGSQRPLSIMTIPKTCSNLTPKMIKITKRTLIRTYLFILKALEVCHRCLTFSFSSCLGTKLKGYPNVSDLRMLYTGLNHALLRLSMSATGLEAVIWRRFAIFGTPVGFYGWLFYISASLCVGWLVPPVTCAFLLPVRLHGQELHSTLLLHT